MIKKMRDLSYEERLKMWFSNPSNKEIKKRSTSFYDIEWV